MSELFCVIMAGGIGSRFWPLSREDKPKQFIDILGTGKSFIRQTYERFSPFVKDENFLVVTSSRYKSQVLEHIPELKESQILCEAMRRNTAPCIAYAAYRIASICSDATMVVAPSDHLVTNSREFERIVKKAVDFAEKSQNLMTIGIKPSRPETGYGYIQISAETAHEAEISTVKTFTEKPDLELAKVFVSSGEFLWNSGIFIWSLQAIKNALKEHTADVDALFASGKDVYNTENEQSFVDKIYPECRNVSIDYGVMEKAHNVSVISADFGWSDIGTWSSLYEHSTLDENGNSRDENSTLLYNCEGCVVRSSEGKVVVVDGLKDYIVVDSDDVILVTPLSKEQQIKEYVDDIRQKKDGKYL
ncbi:MAG: mannose-1-phosphate guanylyltransferase [Rikenellaceae bacterium]